MSATPEESRLFEPTRLGPLQLPNRLVMAPLTRNRATSDGVPTPLMAEYYAQRATAGLIIAEATTPNKVGQTFPDIPALHNDAHVVGWRQVTEAVRAAGGRMFVQLQHGGRVGHPDNSGLVPVAPSPVRLDEPVPTQKGRQEPVVPREMSIDDIKATVADFAVAARRAVDAGFDGVEVHAANGFLLHQFLAKGTNTRADSYGGSAAHRARFPLEVVEAVVEAIGAERVGVRIAPGLGVNGIEEGDSEDIYTALVDGLDALSPTYLHVVFADADNPLFQQIRKAWPGTLIGNPVLGWGDPLPVDGGKSAGERLLSAGADLISYGRGFLANPDLVHRLRTDAPLNDYRPDSFYGGGAEGYTDYPVLAERV
ncbi:alkene reductase [Streptomyces sp. RerS4]|uniref:alkene reductase n=1 Tax=Streptomyces sp. RerS4 TaxID=2942449 RepID=UPI00201C4AF5|nr:alkene reductase [Streptomyces sp. RerS4]UQW99295.1 alkene reductase [Streptomyces sp. RerS4]